MNKTPWERHLLKFRATSATNPQLAYLYIYAHIPLPSITYHTRIARKVLERILVGQQPTHQQLRRLSKFCRQVSKEFQIAQTYSRQNISAQHNSQLLYSLYIYGEHLALTGLTAAAAQKRNKQ